MPIGQELPPRNNNVCAIWRYRFGSVRHSHGRLLAAGSRGGEIRLHMFSCFLGSFPTQAGLTRLRGSQNLSEGLAVVFEFFSADLSLVWIYWSGSAIKFPVSEVA